jgi:formylmethanofuran dehydrogenase subunit E
MFILRLIILLVIVAILLWLLKRIFSADPDVEQLESAEPENMHQCKYCGVHVPESSIVSINDEPYCCQQHADLDQQ